MTWEKSKKTGYDIEVFCNLAKKNYTILYKKFFAGKKSRRRRREFHCRKENTTNEDLSPLGQNEKENF